MARQFLRPQLAGSELHALRWESELVRTLHSTEPPSTFSRCSNRDGEREHQQIDHRPREFHWCARCIHLPAHIGSSAAALPPSLPCKRPCRHLCGNLDPRSSCRLAAWQLVNLGESFENIVKGYLQTKVGQAVAVRVGLSQPSARLSFCCTPSTFSRCSNRDGERASAK